MPAATVPSPTTNDPETMSLNVQNRPGRTPGIEIQTTGDELLVHDTAKAKVHVINATAARIFTLCDGDHTVAEIVHSVVAEWGIEPELARTDVEHVLTDFVQLGLLLPLD
jgi:PqqD family protein of HPr-rel-A system